MNEMEGSRIHCLSSRNEVWNNHWFYALFVMGVAAAVKSLVKKKIECLSSFEMMK